MVVKIFANSRISSLGILLQSVGTVIAYLKEVMRVLGLCEFGMHDGAVPDTRRRGSTAEGGRRFRGARPLRPRCRARSGGCAAPCAPETGSCQSLARGPIPVP